MNFDKISEKNNPLLKRKEIIVKIKYDNSTPSKAVMQQMFAKEFKAEPKNVEITKILSENGKAEGTITIKVWEEKDVGIYGEKKEVPAAPAEGA